MKVIKQEEDVVESRTIGWVSGGAASAVACWLALQKAREEGREVPRFVRIDPLSEHEDAERFVKDLAELFGEDIETISIHQYGAEGFADCKSHFDILRKVRYINGPAGAPCTRLLKREVRKRFEVEQGGEFAHLGLLQRRRGADGEDEGSGRVSLLPID
jgi:NH3-dependent NAD+ synthetase